MIDRGTEAEHMRFAIEELIQKWLAEHPGEQLSGQGQPLDLDEYFRWPEDLRLAYSLLKNSGYVPEEVELLREIDDLKKRLVECLDTPGQKERAEESRISK